MNPRIKQLWVDALKSGEYQQTIGALRKDNSYCALGVLIDVYHKETGNGEWSPTIDNCYFFKIEYPPDLNLKGSYFYEIGQGDLPNTIREWAELKTSNPLIKRWMRTSKTISGLNDRERLSFKEIAKKIDKYL